MDGFCQRYPKTAAPGGTNIEPEPFCGKWNPISVKYSESRRLDTGSHQTYFHQKIGQTVP
jgi:hypothetical protein